MLSKKLLKSNSLINQGFEPSNKLNGTLESHDGSSSCYALDMSLDGLHLLVSNYSEIVSYTLTTPYDMTTATLDVGTYTPVSTYDGNRKGVAWNDDGSRITVIQRRNDTNNFYIKEYDLSTNWDVSSASETSSFNTGSGQARVGGYWNNDGTVYYYSDGLTDTLNWFVCSTAYYFNTRGSVNTKVIAGWLNALSPQHFFIGYNTDGSKCFFHYESNSSAGDIIAYDLSVNYDVTTAINSSYQLIKFTNVSGYGGVTTSISNNSVLFLAYSGSSSNGRKIWKFEDGVTIDDIINPSFYVSADATSSVMSLDANYGFATQMTVSSDENYIFFAGQYTAADDPLVGRINMSSGVASATIDLTEYWTDVYNDPARGVFLSDDGLKMGFLRNGSSSFNEGWNKDLPTPYALNLSSSSTSVNWTIHATTMYPNAVYFFDNGSKFLLHEAYLNKIYEFSTTVAWRLQFPTPNQEVASPINSTSNILMTPNGDALFITDTRGLITKYLLTSNYDITTITTSGDSYFADTGVLLPDDASTFTCHSFSRDLKTSYSLKRNGNDAILTKYIL